MKNILIAEDEKLLAKVLKEEFEDAGFDVISAFNGLDALKELRSKSNEIDLVILDLLMPVVDGFQVLEEMRKDQAHNLSSIPVIVLSNLGQDDEIKRAFQSGAADYFVKSQHPISEVVEKVKHFLEKPQKVSLKKHEAEVKEVAEEDVEEEVKEDQEELKVRKLKVKSED